MSTSAPSDADHTKVVKSESEWRSCLTPEQFRITRQAGTERAFTGPYWDEKRTGLYRCVACGAPLFRSESKYDSGTGWPSFFSPVSDDPALTGLRFCMNGTALTLETDEGADYGGA